MTVTNFSKARKIPTSATTKKSAPTTTNFAKGIYTYKPNDTMDFDEIYLAQNARFDRIGEYKTRLGLHEYTPPLNLVRNSTIDWDNYEMVDVDSSTELVLTGDGSTLYSLSVIMSLDENENDAIRATVIDSSNEVVGISCDYLLGGSPNLCTFIFKDGVFMGTGAFGTYRVRFETQNNPKRKLKIAVVAGTQNYMRDTETTTYTGKIIGMFEANIQHSYAPTDYLTKYIIFAFQPINGGVLTGAKLYCVRVFNSDGAADIGTLREIRTLPDGVKKVRFLQSDNKIRYVDGVEGPRIIDPNNNWSDTAIPTVDLKTGVDLNIKVSNILEGTEDNIIYFDADTTTQAVWTYPYGFAYAPEADYTTSGAIAEYIPGQTTTSTIGTSTLTPTSETHPVSSVAVGDLILDENGNYGEVTTISGTDLTVTSISHVATPINSYDKFDRDLRQNFPAIKTGDPLTAMFNLGGIVYFLTRHKKYYMYSLAFDDWTPHVSTAQHGTFSQESCVCDSNYAYYANDDGVYIFDGTSELSITQNSIQSTYDAIAHKEQIILELHNNRLYVFYPTAAYSSIIDGCLVYNLNLKLWESFDTGLPISSAIARKNASNRFFCGSNTFCQLYTYECLPTVDRAINDLDYADLGAPIDFDLETSYLHFGTPSQLHRITKWRPEFAKTNDDYAIKCGYALDFTDDVKYAFSINLKNNTAIREQYIWDNPPDYGNKTTPTKLTTIPQVNGQFYRCQIRYQLHSAFTPVNFKSHTLSCETQRLR